MANLLDQAQVYARPSAPRVRLTCEACRQRKVKCDKLDPCSSCQRLNLVCVPVERARLPRGRTRKHTDRITGTDKELSDRVARLEKLLRKVATERPAEESSSTTAQPQTGVDSSSEFGNGGLTTETGVEGENLQGQDDVSHSQPPSSSAVESPVADDLPGAAARGVSWWEDIKQEISELQNVLSGRQEGEQLESHDSATVFGAPMVVSPDSLENLASSSQSQGFTLSPEIRNELCDIFFQNVDPLFKVLHRPSMQAYLKEGKPYLNYELDHYAPATLASAVHLAAVCTLEDERCHQLFNTDKKTIVAKFQTETELALAKSDYVTTNDITILQAFIISLVAARSQDQSRRVWTMLAMVLRIGQALCLHMIPPPFAVRPFELEMRQRAWLCIGLLDVAAALDRASEPMMQAAWIDYNLPSNINDDDIWFEMEGPAPQHEQGEFTDMTHTLVFAAYSSVTRAVAFSDLTERTVNIMSLRQEAVKGFQQKASDLLKGCRPEISSFQWYAQKVAGVMGSWLQLACLRPLQRSKAFTPPKVQGDALLKIAADHLQWSQEAYDNPGAAGWRWYGCSWVSWHALAVALAELCVCKDLAVLNKYWHVVSTAHQRSRLNIADSQQGMPSKPLETLMLQAETRRNELLRVNSVQKPTQEPQRNLKNMGSNSSLGQHQHLNSQLYQSQDQRPYQHHQQQYHQQHYPQHPQHPQHQAHYQQHQYQYQPQLEEQGFRGFSLQLEDAINQPRNTHIPEPPTSFAPVPWPNVWDAMDLSEPSLQGSSDDTAWLSYEHFLENVYDNVDSIFVPR